MAKLSVSKQNKALKIVAEWLGPQMGCDGPAPVGPGAAYYGEGPNLIRDWDWPSAGPTPTILLEGGPDDWAIRASYSLVDKMTAIGVFCEPYASYALCLYPYDD